MTRRAHAAGCARSADGWEPTVDDPPCTCGETERRRLAKEAAKASGVSHRAPKRAEPYSHGQLSDLRRDPNAFEVLRRGGKPPVDAVLEDAMQSPTSRRFDLEDLSWLAKKGHLVVVALPEALVKDLIDARTRCEECGDLNAGDQQRANLNEQRAMKAVCEVVRRSYRGA